MRTTWKVGSLITAGALVFGACGDNGTGPNGSTLSASEKTALLNAVTQAGALGDLSGFASFLFIGLDDFGTMTAGQQAAVAGAIEDGINLGLSGVAADAYDGAGVQIVFDVAVPGLTERVQGWFAGVFGWSGLTASGVSEIVTAGAIGLSGTPPSSGSFSILEIDADEGGLATYYSQAQGGFVATSGTVSLSGASFGGGSTDCSGGEGGITVTCSFVVGTMGGGFNFEATQITGSATYSQSQVNFTNLPALQVNITADFGN